MAEFSTKIEKCDWELSNDELIKLICGLSLSALSIIAYANGVVVLAYFVSLIFIVFALFGDHKKGFLFLTLALSNTHVLNLFGISASVLICVGITAKYICIQRRVNGKFIIISLLYLMYSFQYVMRFNDISSGIIAPIKLICVYFTFMVFSSSDEFIKESLSITGKSAKFGALGIIINLLATMVSTSYSRARILNNDSNMLAVEAVIYLSIFLHGYFRVNAISFKKLSLYLFLMGTVIVLCGSRNGYLLLLIGIILNTVLNIKKMDKTFLLSIIIAVIIIILINSDFGQSSLEVLKNRSQALNDRNDISNGRIEIWNSYIVKFNEVKLGWLLGFGNYTNVGLSEMGHNGIVEDISSYGLIGISIICGYVLLIVKTFVSRLNNKYYKFQICNYIPIIILIIGCMTLRSLTNIINTTFLFLGLIIATNNDNSLYSVSESKEIV